MEIITLAATALTMASPYLMKTGEKIAENVGEGIWKFIKTKFTSEKDKELIVNVNTEEDLEKFKPELINKLLSDGLFAGELLKVINKGQNQLINNAQQIVNNNGTVEKQLNIQNNSGDIHL